MSYYRIYEYPFNDLHYRHVYVKRDRTLLLESKEKTILECIDDYKKSDQSLSRARRSIRDLILCNQFDYFCTFTFDDKRVDRYNFKACKSYISKWFNNFKNRYAPDFKYLVVPEFHKDGAIHFHGLIAGMPVGELIIPDFIFKRNRFSGLLDRVPNTPGYMDWPRWRENAGFFNCSPIRDYQRCAFYVTKYVTKDLLNLPKGSSVFMCSKGLQRPQLIFDEDDLPCMFEPTFENEYVATAFSDMDFNSVFSSAPEYEYETGNFDYIWDDHVYFNNLEGVQLELT